MVEDDLHDLMTRFPHGVVVVTVSTNDQRLGLTVGSLVSLSLDPPLVGFAVSRSAAMHELLREMWHGVATEHAASGAPLLVGALGWLECEVRETVAVGTHTLFVCSVLKVESGVDAPSLVRIRGAYESV